MSSFFNLFRNRNGSTESPAAAGTGERVPLGGVDQLLNAAAINESSPVQICCTVDDAIATHEDGRTNCQNNPLNTPARLPPPDQRLFGETSDGEENNEQPNSNENSIRPPVTPGTRTPSKSKSKSRRTSFSPLPTSKRRKPMATTPKQTAVTPTGTIGNNDSSSDESSDDEVQPHPKNTPVTLSPQRKGRTATAEAQAAKATKTRQPPVKKGVRVKSKRSQIYHLLDPSLQKYLLKEHPNYHNYFGTVVKKTAGTKANYDIKYDCFRGGEVAEALRRNVFTTLKKNEDEPDVDLKYQKCTADDLMIDEAAKDTEELKTEADFIKMSNDDIFAATHFTYGFKNQRRDPIKWKIHDVDDDIEDCETYKVLKRKFLTGPIVSRKIDFEKTNPDFFLDYMIPSLKGKAKRIDDYYKSNDAEYYVTYVDRKMRFHDEEAEDPDWKIKQLVLLLIKGCWVSGRGMEQYWQVGKLFGSNLDAGDFGKYMDINEFRVCLAALPYAWTDKALWYRDRWDTPWDVIMPFISAWNDMQTELFEEFNLTITDEETIAWVPKTTKLGGLPNYTWEPRKPKPLGTMLKNTAETVTGVQTYADPIMSPSVQDRKEFGRSKSLSPEHEGKAMSHPPHVAETLRQAHNCGLHKKGASWIGGDAWFGSVASCLALKLQEVTYVKEDGEEITRKMGIDSSFVIKNNTSLFPKRVLHRIMKARHGKTQVGNWVVMSTNIKGVKLIAIAYAWSNKDVSYVLSTMGETIACEDSYVSFDTNNGYDSMETKQHARPEIADFLLRFLPKIDGSNKCRQNELAMEDHWPTKCCWVKLFVAFVGKSVVNQKKLLCYKYPGVPGKDLSTLDMAGTIAGGLKLRDRRVPKQLRENVVGDFKLVRITDDNGNCNKRVTEKQSPKRSTGSARQKTCYCCKKYTRKHSYTSWKCPRCGTALCDNKWKDRQYSSCLAEHINSNEDAVKCNGMTRVRFPTDAKLN